MKQISERKAIDSITHRIIKCAFRVHATLGPGLKEKVYQNAVILELIREGLEVEKEVSFDVLYERKNVGRCRVDLLVEQLVILEIKAVSGIVPKVFERQVLAYLNITSKPAGLLINFGNSSCEIRRLHGLCNLSESP